jgi:prepilin-type N-terminal cleavage/methylation domain-containing protein
MELSDFSQQMDYLRMFAHKDMSLNHNHSDCLPYSVSSRPTDNDNGISKSNPRQISSGSFLWTPAFADVTILGGDKTKPNAGFSLVELSIVLVILGLLVGGVLTGKSLIRAAELRSVTTDQQRFVAAAQIFREKYQAFPGDMTNATAFWGTAAACPGTYLQPSTDATTCNGNGDGGVRGDTTGSNESFRFWQQLANAGLIEGQYSGVTGSALD